MAQNEGRRNLRSLELHVPEPKFRPGDSVDYSDLVIPPAGSAPRPEIDARADSFHELAYSLVRVLDEPEAIALRGATADWCRRLAARGPLLIPAFHYCTLRDMFAFRELRPA